MRKIAVLSSVLLLVLFAGGASAALVGITGTGTAGFQGWTAAADLGQNGSPYWDGLSSDGSKKNIGYYLSGTGSYFGYLPPVSNPLPEYWGYTGGAADPNFFINSATNSKVTIKLEIAGYAGTNRFGYYDVATGARHELFTGSDHVGDVAYIEIAGGSPADIGFYLEVFGSNPSNPNPKFFYTQSARNTPVAEIGKQHFALFAMNNGSYYVAAEDLSLGDKDYNDFVVKIRPLMVPEAGAGLMLMLGLTGLVGYRRKKRMG